VLAIVYAVAWKNRGCIEPRKDEYEAKEVLNVALVARESVEEGCVLEVVIHVEKERELLGNTAAGTAPTFLTVLADRIIVTGSENYQLE
jgi:hypothetical protein